MLTEYSQSSYCFMHYARITHNTQGYQKPSGADGKSASKVTFEGQFKFAWDEWLFNSSFRDNHYHYGFIQGLQHAPCVKYKDLYLVSYNSTTKLWTLQARLSEIERFDANLEKLKNHYIASRLWQTMMQDLDAYQQAEAKRLMQINFGNIVNVRYQDKHLTRFDKEFSLPLNFRYNRINKVGNQLQQIIKTAKAI